jgi:hypothetical protein
MTEKPAAGAAPPSRGNSISLGLKLLVTALLLACYYKFRTPAGDWLAVVVVSALIALLLVVWARTIIRDPRLYGPVLITVILAVGDAGFSILEDHTLPGWLTRLTGGYLSQYSPTFVTILATLAAEMALGRFYWGKWPFLASAYISGISAGILIRSPELWPFVWCAWISICSKYVLRIGSRHLWNPTNFGVTMMLFLAPQAVAPLSVQAGNEPWAVLVIWILGGMIMYRLGLWHLPLTFVALFVPLALFRSWWTQHPWQAELAPITFPMFQLFIFFMITDPKTITKRKWSQVLVVVTIAFVETGLRLGFKDVHSLFHSLFIVGPVANVIEIVYDSRARARKAPPAATPPVVRPAGTTGNGTADGSAVTGAMGEGSPAFVAANHPPKRPQADQDNPGKRDAGDLAHGA